MWPILIFYEPYKLLAFLSYTETFLPMRLINKLRLTFYWSVRNFKVSQDLIKSRSYFTK
jgi:hypothetical protein